MTDRITQPPFDLDQEIGRIENHAPTDVQSDNYKRSNIALSILTALCSNLSDEKMSPDFEQNHIEKSLRMADLFKKTVDEQNEKAYPKMLAKSQLNRFEKLLNQVTDPEGRKKVEALIQSQKDVLNS
jgi:hypothetical protein